MSRMVRIGGKRLIEYLARLECTSRNAGGYRGMITSERIDALRQHTDLGWLTCLRAPAIAALAADDGPLQMTLFDRQDLAEIAHPDYPGERLAAFRNPLLAAERTRKREELLAATEALLAPVVAAVAAGKLHGGAAIGLKTGKLINKYKMAKHVQLAITDTSLTITRDTERITAEQALDGVYVLRTNVSADELDAPLWPRANQSTRASTPRHGSRRPVAGTRFLGDSIYGPVLSASPAARAIAADRAAAWRGTQLGRGSTGH